MGYKDMLPASDGKAFIDCEQKLDVESAVAPDLFKMTLEAALSKTFKNAWARLSLCLNSKSLHLCE